MQNSLALQARVGVQSTACPENAATLLQPAGEDTFAAILQSLLGGLFCRGNESGEAATQPIRKEEPKPAEEAAMALQAELLQAMPLGIVPTVPIAETQQACAAAPPLQGIAGTEISACAGRIDAQPSRAEPQQSGSLFSEQMPAVCETKPTATPAPEEATPPVTQQSRFDSAVQQVKLQLGQSTRRETAPAEQSPVACGQPPPHAPEAPVAEKAEQLARHATVLDQLKAEIPARLAAGKTDFTMKLKPERLGEITVKLVEESGEMTLRITTASSETARMINSDLSALREAVKPLHVVVQEALPGAPPELANGAAQQNAAGQQFANGHPPFARYVPQNGAAVSVQPEKEQAAVLTAERRTSGLDTYV